MREPTRQTGTRRFGAGGMRLLIGLVSTLAFLALWELAGRAGWVDPRYSSLPSRVWMAARSITAQPAFWSDARTSGSEFLLGMVFACVAGVPLGIAMGVMRRLRLLLEPLTMVFYSVPGTTFLPLIILWFGIGTGAYAVLVFLGAVFPILINSMAGMQQVDPALLRAALAFGATRLGIFRHVLLPSSLPFVMNGIRLGIGRGLIGVVLGEMYFSIGGLGHRIMRYQAGLNTDALMFLVCFISVLGVLMIWGARRMEHLLGPWRHSREAE